MCTCVRMRACLCVFVCALHIFFLKHQMLTKAGQVLFLCQMYFFSPPNIIKSCPFAQKLPNLATLSPSLGHIFCDFCDKLKTPEQMDKNIHLKINNNKILDVHVGRGHPWNSKKVKSIKYNISPLMLICIS